MLSCYTLPSPSTTPLLIKSAMRQCGTGIINEHQPRDYDACVVQQPQVSGVCCCQGYRPTIFYPKRAKKKLFEPLVAQCEKMDIPFLSYLPSDNNLVRDSYNLIIDAVFGIKYVVADACH